MPNLPILTQTTQALITHRLTTNTARFDGQLYTLDFRPARHRNNMEENKEDKEIVEIPDSDNINPKVASALLFCQLIIKHRYHMVKDNVEFGEEEYVLSKLSQKEKEAYNASLEFLKQYFNNEAMIDESGSNSQLNGQSNEQNISTVEKQ